MADYYFISLVGPDRAGLVDEVSDLVLQYQGNWMGARMAHLGGMFAGIARIELSNDKAESLEKALSAMSFDNGRVFLQRDVQRTGILTDHTKRYRVEIVANDQPGILKEVTNTISSNGANIEELESRIEDGAMASGPLFRCELVLSCADEAQADKVHEALESLTGEIFIDWHI